MNIIMHVILVSATVCQCETWLCHLSSGKVKGELPDGRCRDGGQTSKDPQRSVDSCQPSLHQVLWSGEMPRLLQQRMIITDETAEMWVKDAVQSVLSLWSKSSDIYVWALLNIIQRIDTYKALDKRWLLTNKCVTDIDKIVFFKKIPWYEGWYKQTLLTSLNCLTFM